MRKSNWIIFPGPGIGMKIKNIFKMVFRIFHINPYKGFPILPMGKLAVWSILDSLGDRATKPTKPNKTFHEIVIGSWRHAFTGFRNNPYITRQYHPLLQSVIGAWAASLFSYAFRICMRKICAANHQSNEKYTKRQKFCTLGRSRYVL